MPPKGINWLTITELPSINNPLFNDENPPFKAELLPDITTPRKIKISCLLCGSIKPYTSIRDQYTYTQTSNYWQHLGTKHKPIYNELKVIKQPSEDDNSS